MNNEELKKKFIDIIHSVEKCSARNNCDTCKYGQELMKYKDMSCRTLKAADALIAAGLTFDKTTAILAERTNSKTLIHKAQYYDEMKHRAEVAERALKICLIDNLCCCECDTRFYKKCKGTDKDKEECAMLDINDYIQQAEKELAEERKDD